MAIDRDNYRRDKDDAGKVVTRIDLEIEPIQSHETTQIVTVSVQPNRRRYGL